MSRSLRQTDKTIEELRAGRFPIAKECSKSEIIKSKDKEKPDEILVTYCNESIELRDQLRCSRYAFPSSKWRNGAICPFATHVEKTVETAAAAKARVGQQKQKKKSRP